MRATRTFRRHPRSSSRSIGVLSLAGLLVACSGNQEPEALPSQTTTQVTPQLEPPPPLPPPIQEVQATRSSSVKVIAPGEDAERPASLAEASALAKKNKKTTPESVLEITDDNLHEFAKSAEIISLESEPAAPAIKIVNEASPKAESEPAAAQPTAGAEDENYWRKRALDLRMGWRRSVDQISEYELESAALRQQFYAEEDAYIRDGQIKPAWDRILDRLDELRQSSERYEEQLDAFIEEGRQAGVPQGWLNEGWELEPSQDERERIERFGATHEPIDVQGVEVDEDAGP